MAVRSTDPESRLQRIRELCARAADTDDADEVREIASRLREELHEQISYLREIIAMHRSRISSDSENDTSEGG